MWKKLNFHYVPDGSTSWAKTHASLPIVLPLGENKYRIYFSTRDDYSRNRTGYIEIEILDRENIIITNIAKEPVLDIGMPGYFDCDGVYASSIVQDGDLLKLYYAGWNAGLRGQFFTSIGLAISDDGGLKFRKYKNCPILSRDEVDPWTLLAPYVLKLADGLWVMWYISGIEIFYYEGKVKSKYDVKTAISTDGIQWKKTGKTAIALVNKDANISRTCILKDDNGLFRAWYSYISPPLSYRLGYAESRDGFTFQRMDNSHLAFLPVSDNKDAWDSDSICYPFVFKHNDDIYLVYNGNNFGKTGLGIALWTEENFLKNK